MGRKGSQGERLGEREGDIDREREGGREREREGDRQRGIDIKSSRRSM